MRKLLGTIVFLAIAFCVIGYFRGWFTFQTNSDGSRSNIELSIDKDRLQQDMDRLKEKVHELSDNEKNDQEIENK